MMHRSQRQRSSLLAALLPLVALLLRLEAIRGWTPETDHPCNVSNRDPWVYSSQTRVDQKIAVLTG